MWHSGQYAEAQAAADSAKKWVTWSVIALALSVYHLRDFVCGVGVFNVHTNAAMLAAMF